MYGYSLEIINRIFLLKKIIIYEIKKIFIHSTNAKLFSQQKQNKKYRET